MTNTPIKGSDIAVVDPTTVVQVQPLVDVVLSGGPGAVASLLILNVIAIGLVSHYIIKLVLNQAKERIEAIERVVAEKESVITERNKRLIELIDNYHDSHNRLIDTLSRTETVLNELRVRVVVYESNNRKT